MSSWVSSLTKNKKSLAADMVNQKCVLTCSKKPKHFFTKHIKMQRCSAVTANFHFCSLTEEAPIWIHNAKINRNDTFVVVYSM